METTIIFKRLLTNLIFLWPFFCVAVFAGESPTVLNVEKTVEDGEVYLSIITEECAVRFEYYEVSHTRYDERKSVMGIRRNCKKDEGLELLYIKEILEYATIREDIFDRVNSIAWGFLTKSGSEALARYAHKSEGIALWNKKNKPATYEPMSYRMVLELINKSGTFGSLKKIFSDRGLSLSEKSIEKLEAARIWDLKKKGYFAANEVFDNNYVVPFQTAVWFSVTKVN